MSILRLIIHLAPIGPLFFEAYFFSVALVLLVFMTYVKTFKIEQQIEDVKNNEASEGEVSELLKLRDRWKALTYLKRL